MSHVCALPRNTIGFPGSVVHHVKKNTSLQSDYYYTLVHQLCSQRQIRSNEKGKNEEI